MHFILLFFFSLTTYANLEDKKEALLNYSNVYCPLPLQGGSCINDTASFYVEKQIALFDDLQRCYIEKTVNSHTLESSFQDETPLQFSNPDTGELFGELVVLDSLSEVEKKQMLQMIASMSLISIIFEQPISPLNDVQKPFDCPSVIKIANASGLSCCTIREAIFKIGIEGK